MGVTKTEHFTDAQNRMAGMLKALGHPARLAIVEQLLAERSCICGDLVSALPLAQPTVSQHLRALKDAGLIKGTVSGTSVCYCLDESALRDLQAFVSGLAAQLPDAPNSCC
jgi:DNA-binding transcriptional ArsR family regulator